MAGKIEITYFDLRGRAEPIRLALAAGGIDFDDNRFAFSEFKDLRSKFPLKAVPVMKMNDVSYPQSNAILRYCGKLGGLYPTDDALKAMQIDIVLDTIADITNEVYKTNDKDPEFEKKRTDFVENSIPKFFGYLERLASDNKDSNEWLFGSSLTIADIGLYCTMNSFKAGYLDHIPTTCLDSFKRLKAVHEAVAANPKIADWEAKHAK